MPLCHLCLSGNDLQYIITIRALMINIMNHNHMITIMMMPGIMIEMLLILVGMQQLQWHNHHHNNTNYLHVFWPMPSPVPLWGGKVHNIGLTTLFKKQLSTIGSYEQALVCIMLEDVKRSTASLEFNHSEGFWFLSLEIVLQTSTNCPQLSCKL